MSSKVTKLSLFEIYNQLCRQYEYFLFSQRLLKLQRHFIKNGDINANIILRKKLWYSTAY